MGAAGADLLERGIEDAEFDDGGGGHRLVGVDGDGFAGGEVGGIEGDFAVEACDLRLQLRGEGRIGLGRGGQGGESEEGDRRGFEQHGGQCSVQIGNSGSTLTTGNVDSRPKNGRQWFRGSRKAT